MMKRNLLCKKLVAVVILFAFAVSTLTSCSYSNNTAEENNNYRMDSIVDSSRIQVVSDNILSDDEDITAKMSQDSTGSLEANIVFEDILANTKNVPEKTAGGKTIEDYLGWEGETNWRYISWQIIQHNKHKSNQAQEITLTAYQKKYPTWEGKSNWRFMSQEIRNYNKQKLAFRQKEETGRLSKVVFGFARKAVAALRKQLVD
jgi:DNA-directed RNA polymerase alpha subunit